MPNHSNSQPLISLPHRCLMVTLVMMIVVIGSSPPSPLSSCDHVVHVVVDTDMHLRISSFMYVYV